MSCSENPRGAVNEWQRSLPPRSVLDRASAANLVLRAHAAKKSNSQVGLAITFRRQLCEQRPSMCQPMLTAQHLAVSMAWLEGSMAASNSPVATALPRWLWSVLSPTRSLHIRAACARSVEIAVTASISMLLWGGNTGHSCKPQRTPRTQRSSCGRGGWRLHPSVARCGIVGKSSSVRKGAPSWKLRQ